MRSNYLVLKDGPWRRPMQQFGFSSKGRKEERKSEERAENSCS